VWIDNLLNLPNKSIYTSKLEADTNQKLIVENTGAIVEYKKIITSTDSQQKIWFAINAPIGYLSEISMYYGKIVTEVTKSNNFYISESDIMLREEGNYCSVSLGFEMVIGKDIGE
jgi:hypothetical protein